MNTQSTLRSFPPAEDFISLVNSIDWKSVQNNIITAAALVAAVVVGIGTKILKAIVKFWEVNGDDIKARATAADYCFIAAAVTYNAGKFAGERYYFSGPRSAQSGTVPNCSHHPQCSILSTWEDTTPTPHSTLTQ